MSIYSCLTFIPWNEYIKAMQEEDFFFLKKQFSVIMAFVIGFLEAR